MSQTKTICRFCKRPPGGVHRKSCKLGKRYAKVAGLEAPPRVSYGYPIANIFDLVKGLDLKVVPIPRGTPMRVQL